MPNYDCDTCLTKYADKDPSTNFVGQQLLLFGAVGLSIQVVATNGSAGQIFIEGTNQEGLVGVYNPIASPTLAANGTAFFNYSGIDPITYMRAMRVRYTASSAGNITISINIRRLAN